MIIVISIYYIQTLFRRRFNKKTNIAWYNLNRYIVYYLLHHIYIQCTSVIVIYCKYSYSSILLIGT